MKIIMLGDSITAGWTGGSYVQTPESYWIQQELDVPVDNAGINGGRIYDTHGNQGLSYVVAKTDFTQYTGGAVRLKLVIDADLINR